MENFTIIRKGCYWVNPLTQEKFVWHEDIEMFINQESGAMTYIVERVSEDECLVNDDWSKGRNV